MTTIRRLISIFVYSLLISSTQTNASTGLLSVSASIINDCNISASPTPLNFGDYNPISTNYSTPLDQIITFSLICTMGSAPTVSIDYGTHAQSTQRFAQNGENTVMYGLFSDPDHSNPWTSTAVGSPAVPTGTGAIQNINIYARVPAGQNIHFGDYTDTITLTAHF